ncbi:uncharacterized protein LOC114283574 [Camellia sinensis]|uniref:uncharacterized protein LOC114283574 n=1 Tax=Camellia sinensis TaxID=4442 RepID=UPI001035A25C|nr:uncharacterized protein LOC114283574 [Camellia sinensis]
MSLSCSSFAIDDHRFKLIGALSATITAFMFVNNDVDLQIQSEANSMKTKVLDQSYLLGYLQDPSHVINYGQIALDDNLIYEEKPIQILDRQVKQLRNKTIPMVKVE